jgi:hypothetical protein
MLEAAGPAGPRGGGRGDAPRRRGTGATPDRAPLSGGQLQRVLIALLTLPAASALLLAGSIGRVMVLAGAIAAGSAVLPDTEPPSATDTTRRSATPRSGAPEFGTTSGRALPVYPRHRIRAVLRAVHGCGPPRR